MTSYDIHGSSMDGSTQDIQASLLSVDSYGQLEKTARISIVRKQIARIKTAININMNKNKNKKGK